MNTVITVPAWLKRSGNDTAFSGANWLVNFRQKQWEAFLKKGLPTQKDERWRYADLTFLKEKHFSTASYGDQKAWQDRGRQYRLPQADSVLLVFMNGRFMPHYSDLEKLPSNIIALSLMDALKQYPDLVKSHWLHDIDAQHCPFASLNAAMFVDGLFLYVPDRCEFSTPIHLLSLASDQDEFIAHPYHMIVLGHQAKLKWVEEHVALSPLSYMMNISSHLVIGQEAQLDYCKIQTESKHAVHIAHTFIRQMQNSQASLTNFSFGGAFVRDEVVVKLVEAGASCHTSGFYRLCENNQYMDQHIDIYHVAPRSNSEMLYKGTVDKKARAVFNGRLYVAKEAQKILAYQANHNLLLSKDAEVYSKPELEIYADDVKCKHGASIGQIDQKALFYLCSRGISHRDALEMMLQGFASDILQRITHPGIRMRVQEGL
jgi:Fe-S cluster assembly protein SufD